MGSAEKEMRKEKRSKKERKERKERKEEKRSRRSSEGQEQMPEPAPVVVEMAMMAQEEFGQVAERQPLGSPEFIKQWEDLRDANMGKGAKKDDQRKSAKNELKTSLETCLKLSQKGLKMCSTSAATYLMEHMTADAEKLKIHLAQDEDYIEELRFKHNKLNDLLDETRDFTPAQLQKDLVRNREIRAKCSQLVRGDAKEEVLVDQDELLELVKVRNSIRLWFGGANMAKAQGNVQVSGEGDEKALFTALNSDIAVKPKKAY